MNKVEKEISGPFKFKPILSKKLEEGTCIHYNLDKSHEGKQTGVGQMIMISNDVPNDTSIQKVV